MHSALDSRTPLLGRLSPAQFMRRHWQKQPLLVRAAWPLAQRPVASTAELFALARQDGVESRLVRRSAEREWTLAHGPFSRRGLPAQREPDWTLLVQGVDLHLPGAHALREAFGFIPHARLDDVMVSYASPGGGVGPHVDAYDVFLLQLHGSRRWRIAAPSARAPRLLAGQPLRILARFKAEQEWLLQPGDMLYLPPLWAHDGAAVGADCITASVGFRTPRPAELAVDLLQRLAEAIEPDPDEAPYADPQQPATPEPGRVPAALSRYAQQVLRQALADPQALPCALGEALSEPKPQVVFAAATQPHAVEQGVRLSPRSRMLYDDQHVFLNGQAWRMAGRDATLLRALADTGRLPAAQARGLSAGAREVMAQWVQAGWLLPPA